MKKAIKELIEKEGNGIIKDGDSVGALPRLGSSTLIPMSPIGDILEG